jgi:carboxypeptidase-like protein/putative zinc finger protein
MQHLDEGTIHAWLDGELSPAERAEVEAHITGCAQCAAAVAEARGFVAASSRILTALDSVPGGVLPAASTGSSGVRHAVPRRFMASRAWMAVAAVLVLSTVTVIATRPNGDTAQLQVAAAARDQKEAPESPVPSQEKGQAMQKSVRPQVLDSNAVGAVARVTHDSTGDTPAAASAPGSAVAGKAPTVMQSRAAAPAEGPKSVDQTERLKSRLEAERKSTLVRPSNGAPRPMADAVSPSRNAEPQPSANRASDKPAAAPAAPGVAKDMAEKREDASPPYDSLSGRSEAASVRDVTITGRVTSESGAPLAAASVMLQGTHFVTLTHDDGTYELLVPSGRVDGQTKSLVARVIGYKASAASIALTSPTITHDFALAPNSLALSEVVVTGAGTASAPEKLGQVTGTDESPVIVSRNTSTESGDSVVTTIYAVSNGTVTLIERSTASDAHRRQKGSAGFSDQVMAKARDDTRINSITWSDSTGRMRTLRGAVPREELERIRTALFGPKP